MRGRQVVLLCCFSLLALPAALCGASGKAQTYTVVHTYPHDSDAFTQGLIFVEGHLYESTGLNGRSSLRMVDLTSGQVLQNYKLPDEYFAEGLTEWGSNLVQLTWISHKAFVYDRFSFRQTKILKYDGEGWGLTHDSKQM